MVALLTASHTTKPELYRRNGISRWRPEQRWQYESGVNTWIKSVQVPDFFAFDPEMMKVLFEKGLDLGRNPSSWVAAPSPGQNASPWLIKLLNELRRER